MMSAMLLILILTWVWFVFSWMRANPFESTSDCFWHWWRCWNMWAHRLVAILIGNVAQLNWSAIWSSPRGCTRCTVASYSWLLNRNAIAGFVGVIVASIWINVRRWTNNWSWCISRRRMVVQRWCGLMRLMSLMTNLVVLMWIVCGRSASNKCKAHDLKTQTRTHTLLFEIGNQFSAWKVKISKSTEILHFYALILLFDIYQEFHFGQIWIYFSPFDSQQIHTLMWSNFNCKCSFGPSNIYTPRKNKIKIQISYPRTFMESQSESLNVWSV